MSTVTQVSLYAVVLILCTLFIGGADKRFAVSSAVIVGFIAHPRYYLYTLLQGVNRMKEYANIVVTERCVSIVISIAALLIGCRDFRLMIVFDVIGRMLSFMLAIMYCKEIVFRKPVFDKGVVKKSLSYILSGVMILFAVQTSNIVVGINRFGFERQWGIEEFGKLSLAIALSNMVLRCVNSVSVVMFPTLRNVDYRKLPDLYQNINAIMMTGIFIFMCLFKPGCHLIGLWLPQYSDSMKYSILMLPICIYECKYSMLINTNLKTLNKEKMIGAVNSFSVIVSLLTAIISIAVLKNTELAIIGILVALSARSMMGEWFISKMFHINVWWNMISEFVVSILFIFCMYYHDGLFFYLLYLFVVCGYMWIEKDKLLEMLDKMTHPKEKKHGKV